MADDLKGYSSEEVLNKVLNTSNDSLKVDVVSGAEYEEDATHSSGDTGNFVLAVRNDTLAFLGADGDYVPFQVNADGALYVEAAVESGKIKSGAIASGALASGSVSSGAVASGAIASGAVASGAFASGSIASGAVASGAIASGAVASGALASGSVVDGAMVTLGAKADAKSSATDTTSITAMQVLKQISASVQETAADTGTIDSDTDAIKTAVELLDNAVDGAYLNVNMNLAGSDAQAGEGTISATTQRVTIATDDDGVAHLSTIAGAVSTQMQVDVVASLPAGDNNIGNVDIVTLPASTNTIEVVGDVAEDSNAGGNPVLVGGRYDSPGDDNSSLRSLDDTDVGALALDPTGAAYVREHLGQSGSCFVSGTAAVTAAYGKFVAIQFLEDTVFNGTDGLVATDTGRWPDDSAAASDISSSNTAAVGSQTFPQGMTIFGRWDSFILVSGAVIAYVGNV